MNAEILRVYRAERAKGIPATNAYAVAKHIHAEPAHPFLADLGYGHTVTGQVGPYEITVKVVIDEDAQLGDDDVTGTFTDRDEDGCVKNTLYGPNGQRMKYYLPSNYTRENTYNDLRAQGMSKSVARDAYNKRVQAEMYDDAHREYYGVMVTASVAGREVGSASLWGIDSVPGYDVAAYFREVAVDLISEATSEAAERLPTVIAEAENEVAALRSAAEADQS